jgi:hypothetical protein
MKFGHFFYCSLAAAVLTIFGSMARPSTAPTSAWILPLHVAEAAAQFFNRPYPTSPESSGSVIHKWGLTAYRPNHGISNGLRKAALCLDLADLLEKEPTDPKNKFQAWLKARTTEDPAYIQKIAMASMMSRAGREDESDDVSGETRAREMNTGAELFGTVAEKSGMSFTSEELRDFENGIRMDGTFSRHDANSDYLSRFLRFVHDVELTRLGWNDFDGTLKWLVPDVSEDEITALYHQDHLYLTASGDTRYHGGEFTIDFFKLSADPSALMTVLEKVRADHPL